MVSYSLPVWRDIRKRLNFLYFGSDLWSWVLCEGVKYLLDVELPDPEMLTLLQVCQSGLQMVISFPKPL